VPVFYTDFLSDVSHGQIVLWAVEFCRSPKKIKVIDHCKRNIRISSQWLTAEDLFQAEDLEKMTAFVRVIPNGDILPSRAGYSTESKTGSWRQSSIRTGDDSLPMRYGFPCQTIASKILNGRVPQIVDAFRI